MPATQHIDDKVEWDMVLEKTQVVVADCMAHLINYALPLGQQKLTPTLVVYADWCGPCKMIGPHFERLADEYAKPKKMAFVKVNTEKGSIGQMYGVRSLPTFKVLHKGVVVETVTGANPAALAGAIVKASKLVQGGGSAEVFGNRGQTLGGSGASGSSLANIRFDPISIVNHVITIIGLYLVSFFSQLHIRCHCMQPCGAPRDLKLPARSSNILRSYFAARQVFFSKSASQLRLTIRASLNGSDLLSPSSGSFVPQPQHTAHHGQSFGPNNVVHHLAARVASSAHRAPPLRLISTNATSTARIGIAKIGQFGKTLLHANVAHPRLRRPPQDLYVPPPLPAHRQPFPYDPLLAYPLLILYRQGISRLLPSPPRDRAPVAAAHRLCSRNRAVSRAVVSCDRVGADGRAGCAGA
ncbi:thioredoxin-like protein [Beauveria bassiana ARSEF 2860]|uniref:Thioredoxin-like protein n=1 Tax=Beauveria bassiana (strain ARSEF 2860) TaxID=655819 RepID=J4UGV2_BEAB2|nr:thioredoxin-like protein [Beauveria bassiana ARSEF 2860]EJP62212.1 thioredoxin-like protein [Beauveria bassiana ARSEF 2860]